MGKLNLLSIIVPAYKQEKTIKTDVEKIVQVMSQLHYDYEIIVVVDGLVDGTFKNAKKIKSPKVIVIGYQHNHGKGYAVRFGMAKTKGSIIAFIDAGMDINPSGLLALLKRFESYDADIIIGSKRHPESKVKYPLERRIISFLSQTFIRILFGLNVRDTQVGIKFFKKEVIENVLPRLLVKKFAFDIVILVVAFYLGYHKIYEAPIELNFNFGRSIVSQGLLEALLKTFWDSLAVFYRLKILRYYDDRNKRKWKYDPELNFRVNTG